MNKAIDELYTMIETSERFSTERLALEPLTGANADFIHALVNTEGWLKFIGDRKVHSREDAVAYVARIRKNAAVRYWAVRLKETGLPIGIVTFIKRDYLPHHDLGFAFLPEFNGKGYAFESAITVLRLVARSTLHQTMFATTMPANTNSIKLLTRLGFRFQNEILVENERLHVYAITAENVLAEEKTG